MKKYLVLASIASLGLGVIQTVAQETSISKGVMRFRAGSFEVSGQVNSLDGDGECWVLLQDVDTQVMELSGLPSELQLEGLRIVATVHMDERQPFGECIPAIFRLIVEDAQPVE